MGGVLSMSALGHEQTSRHVRVMSVIPLKADIHQRGSARPLSASNGRIDQQADSDLAYWSERLT